MKLYFSYNHLPEFEDLTPRQRKAVYRCALEAYLAEDSSRLWFGTPWGLGGLVAGTMVGWGLVHLTGSAHPGLLMTLCALGGAVLALFLAGPVQMAQLRPYLRRVLEERRDEIAEIR